MKALQKVLGVFSGVGSFRSAACLTSTSAPGSMENAKTISYENLKKLVAEDKARIFDVRSPDEVAQGCIANSINIPVTEVEEAFQMDPEAFKRKYGAEKPQKDEANLVFHCHMGKRGGQATKIATELGFAQAHNYTGGYKEWLEKEGK